MPTEYTMNLAEFQHLVAALISFGDDIISGCATEVERCEVRMAFCSDGCVMAEKKRTLRKASSLPERDRFMTMADLLWQVASGDGMGKVLSICNKVSAGNEPVIALSLCSHQEAT